MFQPTADENRHALPPLVDGHTHLDQFDAAELPGILGRAAASGVGLIISAATTLESCKQTVRLAGDFPLIYAGVGLHPMDLKSAVGPSAAAELRELAQSPKVVVWSETGLDYLPTSPPRDVQEQAFRAQAAIARDLGLPMVIHSREADDDMVPLLREEGVAQLGGAWHYFQGGMALAEQVLELGMYISLAKPLLRLPELLKVAAKLPLERIVIETDSYPQTFKKHRERWTEPWHLPQVAEKLAELQGVSAGRVAEATTANYLRMLKGRVPREALPLPVSPAGG